jgi:surface antigen
LAFQVRKNPECLEHLEISTINTGSLSARMLNEKRLQLSSRLQKQLKRKSSHKRLVRYGLIAANVAVLATVVGFVVGGSHNGGSHLAAVSAQESTNAVTKPVDGQTSYDIAANVAKITDLPESTAINNQAQSARVAVAVSTSDTNVVAKPQIVSTALKSKSDIKTYTVLTGDTVTSIAQKFGVTSDSIKWSNNLTSDSVALGTKLTIPPVNGVVYTVKSGDTVQTLAAKYKASVDQIVAYNDAEIAGLVPGEVIIIPNGQVVPVAATGGGARLASAGSFVAQYGSNGYDYGYCTYYAAARSGAPSNWGNANTWAYYAALSGWTVSSTPRVGAIAQTSRGYLGHVAIVEAVSADGSQMKYSDMNGIAGWGRVGYSDWVASSYFEHYISR